MLHFLLEGTDRRSNEISDSHSLNRVEIRLSVFFICLFLVSFFILLSQFSIVTKLLLIVIYCLFGIIFLFNGISIFNVYFLFFLLSNLYLTLRYFIVDVNEIILDKILAYFLVVILIICLLSITRKYFRIKIINRIGLLSVSSYKRRLIISFILYLIVYYFLVVRSFQSFNIESILTQSLILREKLSSSGSQYLNAFLDFLSNLVFIYAVLIDYLNKDKTKFRNLILIIILLLSLPLGSRGLIVFDVFEYLIFNYLIFGKFNFIRIGIIAIIGIIFVAWYGKIRNNGEGNADASMAVKFAFSRFDAIDNYINIYPYFNGKKSFGTSIPAILLQPIPRSVYHDKPELFNTFLTEKYFPQAYDNNVTFDFSAFPEALYNFGKIGIILLGIYLGTVFKIINDLFRYARKNRSCIATIIYSKLYLYPIFVFITGWIDSGTTVSIIIGLFTLFFTIILIKGKGQHV